MKNTVTVALLLGALCFPAGADAAVPGETIGIVRNVSGDATITRGEKTLPAVPGLKLLVGDTLGTGRDGSLGVILRDDSSLSIGPGEPSRPPEFPLLVLGRKVRPGGTNHPGDDGVPLGPDRQAGPRKRPLRNPDRHHRHPGNALRREGGGTFLSMNEIDPLETGST